MSKSYRQCPQCYNTTEGYHIYSCKDCGKIYCASCLPDECGHCKNELRSLFNTIRDEGVIKADDTLEKLKEFERQREYERQNDAKEYKDVPVSRGYSSGGGTSGGQASDGVGSFALLLGVLFLIWLAFHTRDSSPLPPQESSKYSAGSAPQTDTFVSENSQIMYPYFDTTTIKYSLLGKVIGGKAINNIDEIILLEIMDSSRIESRLFFKLNLNIKDGNTVAYRNAKILTEYSIIQKNAWRLDSMSIFFENMGADYITSGQSKISGYIINQSGEPIIGANVIVDALKGQVALANDKGSYELNLPPGLYHVIYRYTSKQDFAIDVNISDGQNLIQNVTLEGNP